MATLSQIFSPVWTYSSQGQGAIAEGISAIRQCIDIIIRTTKGSNPIAVEFGSDVYKYQDYPVNVAVPSIKKAITEAVGQWEPRVTITTIHHTIDGSNLIFEIGYTLVDGNITDSLSVIIGSDGITSNVSPRRLILQGYIPPNPSFYQYSLTVILNGSELLPAPPENGFGDALSMLSWARANYSTYADWYLTNDSIVGYIKPGYKTGSIAIELLVKSRFAGVIGVLPIGYRYAISITVDGQVYSEHIGLYTPNQLMLWASTVLGGIGKWQIESEGGAFGDDFSDDFNVTNQYLALYTDKANSVSIIIDIEVDA